MHIPKELSYFLTCDHNNKGYQDPFMIPKINTIKYKTSGIIVVCILSHSFPQYYFNLIPNNKDKVDNIKTTKVLMLTAKKF